LHFYGCISYLGNMVPHFSLEVFEPLSILGVHFLFMNCVPRFLLDVFEPHEF
jgi:hypothetical protein